MPTSENASKSVKVYKPHPVSLPTPSYLDGCDFITEKQLHNLWMRLRKGRVAVGNAVSLYILNDKTVGLSRIYNRLIGCCK